MRKVSMFVFSNPMKGMDKEYREWYVGQHVHDLLRIPGFVGCTFYKLVEPQLYGTVEDKIYRYIMIWDWETDDVEAVYKEILDRKKDGRTTFCAAFDRNVGNIIAAPITKYITAEEVRGMTPEEILALSGMEG